MKELILLANEFPYGNWEPYLETEVKYYKKFDKVYICSLQTRKEHMNKRRKVRLDNVFFCTIPYERRCIYLLNAIYAIFDKNFYQEVFKLFHQKRFNFGRLVKLVVFISRSHYEARIILTYLKEHNVIYNDVRDSEERKGILYSYRFEYQPYLGFLIQKHLPGYKIVSRAHRFDLYEEMRDVSYIPLREFLLSKLDRTVLISNNGKEYLAKKYPKYENKLVVFRLGTLDCGIRKVDCPDGNINVVSCSTICPVKRVNMIVEALSKVHDVEVNWIHYGEGEQLPEIMDLCSDILPSNIHFKFKGYVDNEKVLEDYSINSFHLFLNVSESEGIPVSIMEALSFGIPCIATDVGGTHEIVENEKNGILLEKDFDIDLLTDLVVRFANMSNAEYQLFRKNARISWLNKYSAEENYSSFVDFLLSDM